MEMTRGEFLDRLSILLLKAERIGPECYPEFIKYAKDLFLNMPLSNTHQVLEGFRDLYLKNSIIWDLESDIRKGKEEELGLEEVGKRALDIRDWNKERIAIQNVINEIFDEPKNIKKDHISE